MKSIARLKDEARRHEQSGNWTGAIDAYMQVIALGDQPDGDGERELPLFNRIGDLFVRLGQPLEAVGYYEDAADRYADAGLHNNAIALCNKALRYLPDRVELYRKLGRLSAAQGFQTDARRWFVDYAEAMFRQGREDDAFGALGELAAVSNDPEMRLLLGRRLHAKGRTAEAVIELTRACGLYLAAASTEQADEVRAEILALDPDADPDTAIALAALAEAEAQAAAEAEAAAERPGATDGVDADTEADAAALAQALAAASEAAEGVDAGDIGLETTAYEPRAADELAGALLEDLAAAVQSAGHAPDDGAGSVLEGFEATDLGADADTGLAGVDIAYDPLPELPELDGPADDAPLERHEAVGLPLLNFGDAPEIEGGSPVDLHAGLAAAWQELEAGRPDSARAALDTLHAGLADAGHWEDAVAAIDARIELDPDALPLQRQRVEYAQQTGDPEQLAAAYGALADTLERTGAEEHAAAVRTEMHDLAAEGGAAEFSPVDALAAPVRPEQGAVDSGERYVDLAAMLTEAPVTATRFFVEEKTPTGDEDLDFAELLAQFKSKVSESLDREDAGSHYDLGLAFKEMGLLDEAIAEFQVALRAGDARLKIFEEIGQCFFLKGQHGIALKVLRRALEMETADELEMIGVYYYLGRASEATGQRDDARDAYERVLALELNFEDVQQRLERL